MRFKHTLFTIWLSLLSVTAFSQYNYVQRLSSLATVGMPDTPKMFEKDGVKSYALNHNGVIFIANFAEVKTGLKGLFSSSKNDSIYTSFINGLIRGTGGKVLYKDKIKINDHPGIQLGYQTMLKGQQFYGYHRVVILSDTLISCGILSVDLLPKNDKNVNAFFDTFKVISVAELDEVDASNAAHKIGSIIGTLIAFSLPVAIGLAIVFLLKKIIYKKRKQQSP